MKTEIKRGRKLGETFKNGYREARRFFTFKPKGSKVFYMNFYDMNGRRHVKTTKSTNQDWAEIELGKIREAVKAGDFNIEMRKKEKVEFKTFAVDFIEKYSKKKKFSWESDQCNIAVLNRFFDKKYLYEITARDVEDFIEQRSNENKHDSNKRISPTTVNKEAGTLQKIFAFAIKIGLLHKNQNPTAEIEKLPEPPPRGRYLEREELNTLLAESPEKLKAMIILAVHCGMRRSEIFDLTWDKINSNTNIITVQQRKIWKTRKPKTKYIPMNPLVRQTLEILKTKRKDVKKSSDYVFPGKKGERLTSNKKMFSTALEKAGIINFRFHDLKHTCVTQLIASGADIKTIQDITGNNNIDILLNTYAHSSEFRKQRAVDDLYQRLTATKIDEKLIEMPKATIPESVGVVTQVFENKVS
jgi:integrase